jgi:hypothetical protein
MHSPLRTLTVSFSILFATACGSSAPTPASADGYDAVELVSDDAVTSLLPANCDQRSEETGECLPPGAWVSKLCNGVHPEVALHMFRGGSPWTRLYSRANAPAYNGAGGPSVVDDLVTVHEELIALRRHDDSRSSRAGEMSVGDTAGYDLLRWNGSCVTLHDGEFIADPPRRRQHAKVEWRWLGDETRSALRKSGLVRRAYKARLRECQGATLGRVTKACVENDQRLVAAIVHYVRAGGHLPEPSERL